MLGERGFDSLWVAEHSHIPVTRRFNVPTGELERQYHDVIDPFVTLSTAAAVTRRLKLATGVCLVIQRDTIQTAKLVASLDQVSGGRFIFGIGGGWNAKEMEDHGTIYETRFKKLREQIEAMKGDLDQGEDRIPRRAGRFSADDDLAQTSPEAAPADHCWRRLPLRRPTSLERRVRRSGGISPAVSADGARSRARSKVVIGDLGRRPEDLDRLKRYRAWGWRG
jgi:alkanesulfonate monooxygenase SsuD/methylene tetrahydromethanopterin reductase-like flavin-dependent oxidoreductase (luciferase family)